MEVYADMRGKYAELYFTNERPNRQGNYTFNRFHFGDYGVGNGYGSRPTPPTPPIPPTPPTPPVPQYCSEADMSIILSQISQEPFDDTRLNYLKTVTISKQPFTTEQIRRIASKFTFDNKRMEYVKYSFRYCYDVDNYFTLTDLFVHKSDKEKLMKFIQDNLR